MKSMMHAPGGCVGSRTTHRDGGIARPKTTHAEYVQRMKKNQSVAKSMYVSTESSKVKVYLYNVVVWRDHSLVRDKTALFVSLNLLCRRLFVLALLPACLPVQ